MSPREKRSGVVGIHEAAGHRCEARRAIHGVIEGYTGTVRGRGHISGQVIPVAGDE